MNSTQRKFMKIKNEILYKICTSFSDFFLPPSAEKQKDRYRKRYGLPDKDIIFYGKGTWTDICVLRGKSFYEKLADFSNSDFVKQMRKDIKEKGSFCPSDYEWRRKKK